MGVPLVIIHFYGIFPYKPSSYGGAPLYGNPHVVYPPGLAANAAPTEGSAPAPSAPPQVGTGETWVLVLTQIPSSHTGHWHAQGQDQEGRGSIARMNLE